MPHPDQTIAPDVLLRIDRVGSYLLTFADRMTLGGPGTEPQTGHIGLYGKLSSKHAEIKRTEHGYTITPLKGAVTMNANTSGTQSVPDHSDNSRLLMKETLLSNDSQFQLDDHIKLQIKRISPLCQTAVLQAQPSRRFLQRVDGVVLADTMVLLGPGNKTHIRCPHWSNTGALIFHEGQFRFRSPIGLSQAASQNVIDQPLVFDKHLEIAEFGLYLEPCPTDCR